MLPHQVHGSTKSAVSTMPPCPPSLSHLSLTRHQFLPSCQHLLCQWNSLSHQCLASCLSLARHLCLESLYSVTISSCQPVSPLSLSHSAGHEGAGQTLYDKSWPCPSQPSSFGLLGTHSSLDLSSDSVSCPDPLQLFSRSTL